MSDDPRRKEEYLCWKCWNNPSMPADTRIQSRLRWLEIQIEKYHQEIEQLKVELSELQ